MNEGESCIMFGHAELKLIYHFPEVTLQMLIVGLGGGGGGLPLFSESW